MNPLLIAHRGNTNDYPENTLEAFNSAFTLGADGIECDIQLLNGELIVVHNFLFDRSAEYLKLKDVLKQFAHKGRIEIEIKAFTYKIIPKLKDILSQYSVSDIELTSSVLFLFPELRKMFPDVSLGVIFQSYEFEPWMTEEFRQLKIVEVMETLQTNVAHIPYNVLNSEITEALHSRNMKVHSHIYKKKIETQVDIYNKLKELLVDQCTFDDINLLYALSR